MSRDDRDKRGGHARRHTGTYSCGCCEILRPKERSENRATRNRALDQRERRAEEA
ncbi:hypothetical protein ACFVU2_19390 [Leifsonia sp. NPDC058194]|uniref:hypothetical protein n=1 Tax=Leifsonia sp. NPDC058194 TaxID=3346374 RepID=UPI0036DA26A0